MFFARRRPRGESAVADELVTSWEVPATVVAQTAKSSLEVGIGQVLVAKNMRAGPW